MFGTSVYAEYVEDNKLELQDTSIEKTDVTFDAYFENDKHQLEADIEEGIKLYLHINIKSGYLENASINMQGANFKLNTDNMSNDIIERIDTENNSIYFNQLNKGKDFTLELPIVFNYQESFEIANLVKENGIILTGNYITEAAKTVQVNKEIKVKIAWTNEAIARVEQSLSKYVSVSKQTTTNNQTETISQTLIQTVLKTNLENNTLPVKETYIQITVPELDGKKPTEVSVISTSLEATNGGDGTEFTSDNYTYNADTGVLEIKVENPENNGKVTWKKNAEDEYHINYVYDFTVASLGLEQEAEVTIATYGDKTFSETSTLTNSSDEKVGSVISNSIQFVNTILDKGYLYENNNYKTEYQVTLNQEIDYLEMLGEGLSISPSIDKFTNKDKTEVDISSKTKITEIKINKANFDQILGEDGTIQVLQNGNVIATINKETTLNENQEYVVVLDKNSQEITFVTSKPIAKGKLQIKYSKQIDSLEGITEEQIASFASLKTAAKTEILKTGFTIPTKTIETQISLREPVTTIEANINKTSLSTITKNEDVQINIVLKNNNVQYDLYKNPVVQIELPSYMTSIDVKELKLLYENEMVLGEATIQDLENGDKLITIPMSGEQTKYHTNDVTGGATIVLNADITMDRLTPSKEENIKISVTNEKAHSYENVELGKAYEEIAIRYVAPTGMVTVNKITMNDQIAMSISGEKASMQVDAQSSSKTANVEMIIINNNTLPAEEISILGRIPFAGNKNITTGEDLGSTFTANITGAISAKTGITNEQMKVYYSGKEDATKDLADTNNGWTLTPENLGEVKSYLVVLENYELPVGGTIELSYPIQIPENLKHSQETNASYVVYYVSKVKGANTKPVETAQATTVEIVTPQGPDLEVSITSNVAEGEAVKEGQIVQYTVTVKNIGDITAESVIAYGNVPEGANYAYKQENGFYQTDSSKNDVRQVFETIKPQESQSFTYEVKVKSLNSTYQFEQDEDGNVTKEEYSISTTARVTARQMDNYLESNAIKHFVEEGNLSIELKANTEENVKIGQEIEYTIKVTNPTNQDKENVTVTVKVPEGAKFLEGQFSDTDFEVSDSKAYVIESNEKQIKWNIPKVLYDSSEYITYTVVVAEGASEVKNSVEVTCENITTKSNEVAVGVKQLGMEATQTCDIDNSNIMVNDIITYTITVKNTGNDILRNVVITDSLPEQLQCIGLTYITGGTEKEETTFSETIPTIHIEGIATGQSAIVKIKAKVGSVSENTKISNVAKVKATDIAEMETNAITHTIKAGSSEDNNTPGGDNVNGAYNISGTVWVDSNKNATKDETENRVRDVRVLLITKENGILVKEVATDTNGKYEFTGLENGEYIVIFLYNNQMYGITDYQKAGIETSKNSDATQMEINLNGELITGAATDTLMVKDVNLYNIDLGLLQKEKFDLKLDKEISQITVQNTQGTKNYTYDAGTTMAKVDISPKYINGTNVVITYKIKITNEGDVAGYAKNIVDYLSSDVKFSSELNADWYQGKDGNIYTTSLANTLINPGETKEITLVVTKQMTEENTGLVNNTAEIQESYNDYAIADTDSTPGNKAQSEDDYGKANIYLSLNTGGAATYAIITIVMISILGAGAYFLKKKVLKRI